MSNHANSGHHTWRFFRAGGFDQVRLDTGADIANLGALLDRNIVGGARLSDTRD